MASLPQNPFAIDTKPTWQEAQTLNIGRHRFILQKQINLTTLLSNLPSSQPQSVEPRYIYLYCDVLELDWNTSNDANGGIIMTQIAPLAFVRELHIKARSFFPAVRTRRSKDTDLSTLLSAFLEILLPGRQAGDAFVFSVVMDDMPDFLTIKYGNLQTKYAVMPESSSGAQSSVVVTRDSMGFQMSLYENGLMSRRLIAEVLPDQLESNMSDIIAMNGMQKPSFFGQLLEHLFVEAAAIITNPSRLPEAMSMFRFISRCSKNASSYAELNMQSAQMLARANLLLNSVYPIPNTSVDRGEKNLIYWLDESKIQSSQAQVANIMRTVVDGTATVKEIGATIVQQLGYSHENYPLNLEVAKEELLLSTAHYSNRRVEFEQAQSNLTTQQKKFAVAVDSWKQAQTMKAVVEGVFAVVELVGAIAGAFACGATSAAAVESAAKAVDAIKKGTTIADKIASLVEKMAELQRRSDEFIKLIQTLRAAYDVIKASGKADSNSDNLVSQQVIPMVTGTVDFVGLKLKWSDYSIDMKNMFQVMRAAFDDFDPQEIGDFEVAMSKLTTRATAVIDAQKEIQLLSNKVSRAMADVKRLEDRKKELNDIAGKMVDDAVNQRAMADALQVYVDSSTTSRRDKSISFTTTDNSYAFDPFWRGELQNIQRLRLTVDPTHPQFENWRSASIKGVNISMRGLSLKLGQNKRDQVLFKVGLDQSMQVKLRQPPATELKVANFYADFSDDLLAQEVVLTPMAGSTDLFQTKDNTEMSLIATKKILPSLFGIKSIRLSLESQKVFDLSTVDYMSVTFLCDVAYI